MCICVARAVIDVMMIAKLARGIFACVARDVVITSRHFVSREWITHASSIVRTINKRLRESLEDHERVTITDYQSLKYKSSRLWTEIAVN